MRNIHIVSGCHHVPFHNKVMIAGMCNLIKDLSNKIAGFHLLGDFVDMNSLSAHDRGQVPIPGITLSYEYEQANNVLDMFDKALPKGIDKNYLYGNHEDRYLRHLKAIDNSKYGEALLSPEKGLQLKERGYKVKTRWKEDYFLIGKHLQAIHGEYCNLHPAKKHLQKLGSSCIFAHTHRIGFEFNGKSAAFNIGWCGDKEQPAFNYVSRMTKKDWINGFALVTIDEMGFFHTQTINVYDNHFYYNGKKY